MRLQDYDITRQFKATLVNTERVTPVDSPDEVREIILDVNGDDFAVKVGQNIGVLVPGQVEFGQNYHLRLYSIADIPEKTGDGCVRLPICVRRCNYVDEYSGEEYKGIASNYLCDLCVGDTLILTGPYGSAFEAPEVDDATLIMIGAGTGIAPFRAFVKYLYNKVPEFKGRVCLFHGARSGLDLLYMNDERNDFALYYDKETFEAIVALSQRPHWSDKIDWNSAIESRGEEIWKMLMEPRTYVYVAGLEPIREELEAVFARIAGSRDEWARRKAELVSGKRWNELLY